MNRKNKHDFRYKGKHYWPANHRPIKTNEHCIYCGNEIQEADILYNAGVCRKCAKKLRQSSKV